MSTTPSAVPEKQNVPWPQFAGLFLRIGVLGFGGPQAHIAMLRNEIVEIRQWVDPERFEEGLGLCEALPGPASSQMAIYLGWLRRGWIGGLVSGSCFLLPGLLIVLLLSELWRNGQALPSFTTALQTIQPVVAAIIWAFAWKLIRRRTERWQILTAALVMLGVLLNTLGDLPLPAGLLLLLAGLARLFSAPLDRPKGAALLLPLPLGLTAGAGSDGTGLMTGLFSVFFKTGLLVFGGGLVIIPLLQQQVVELGWLSPSEFLDGVAIGQISPGPVVLTSTFVGYQAGWNAGGFGAGLAGAAAATIGIFLPSFGFILLATPLLQRLRRQPRVRMVLAGLLAGVPGAVAGAAVSISARAMQVGLPLIQLPLFVVSLWLSVSGRMKPLPLIAIALMIGVLIEALV
jgi:chromate transporter